LNTKFKKPIFGEFFKDNTNLIEAGNLFKVASENYNKVLEGINININEATINGVSSLLFENTKLEGKIGKLVEKASN